MITSSYCFLPGLYLFAGTTAIACNPFFTFVLSASNVSITFHSFPLLPVITFFFFKTSGS